MLTNLTRIVTIDAMRPTPTGLAATFLLLACREGDGVTSDTSMVVSDETPSEGPGFDVRYRTMYVDVATGFTQSVCRGTLEALDRHVELVSELLDIDVQRRITWEWVNEHADGSLDSDDRCEWCANCSACYRGGGVVYSGHDAIFHELTHGIVIPAWGRSDILFNEGVAVAFEGKHVTLPEYTSYRPSEAADESSGPHFTRWILDRYGPATLRELFSPRLDGSSTREDVFAAVEEVFGMPFAELEDEYFATAATIYPAPGLCDGLVNIPWRGDRWELRVTADCDAPHVFGPLDVDATKPADEPAPIAVVVTIDVPAELDGVPLTAWIPSDERATLWPCLDAPSYDPDPELAEQAALSNAVGGALRAGRYRLELPVYEPGEAYMRICPHNGAPPSLDPTVDPERCLGD